jgi:hypothetical protein
MTQTVVPRETTAIDMVEVIARLGQGYYVLTEQLPSPELLGIAAGIIGVENAGGASINNRNIGNITAPASYDGPVWEANGLRFIDFTSIEESTYYWWRLMMRRYRAVLQAADAGDAELAARELYRLGYVSRLGSASPADYGRGVRSYYRKMASYAEMLGGRASPVVGAVVGGGAAAALLVFGALAHGRAA